MRLVGGTVRLLLCCPDAQSSFASSALAHPANNLPLARSAGRNPRHHAPRTGIGWLAGRARIGHSWDTEQGAVAMCIVARTWSPDEHKVGFGLCESIRTSTRLSAALPATYQYNTRSIKCANVMLTIDGPPVTRVSSPGTWIPCGEARLG
jgi:hypothetical protein